MAVSKYQYIFVVPQHGEGKSRFLSNNSDGHRNAKVYQVMNTIAQKICFKERYVGNKKRQIIAPNRTRLLKTMSYELLKSERTEKRTTILFSSSI